VASGVNARLLLRLAVDGVVTAAALLALAAILPGLHVRDAGTAVAAVVMTFALNTLLWPLVIRFALPLTVLTLGLGALALNGAILLLVAAVLPGFTIDGLFEAVVTVLGITAARTTADAILSIDDDTRIDRHRTRRAALGAAAGGGDVPGVLFLEIDGLAHEVLRRALRDGNAPTLARWVRDGSHHLVSWETDLSSQTGACQAGLLHGSNDDMPAFRWWEKDRDAPIVTNHPRDAAELERRISNGRGLLHEDGASRANILSGDAPHSLLTMSTVLDVRRGRIGRDYFTYFASPYNVARTLLLSLADVARELRAAVEQRRRDVQPRIRRGLRYALVRAWAVVVQRDLQVAAVLGDVHAGRPVLYTTFLAYDEVAHHSGVERPDTLAVLRIVDLEIARIAAAAARARRPYEIVVLSDHGQSQGATFLQRYGLTLEELVSRACGTDAVAAEASGEDEALGRLRAAVTEASRADTAAGRTLARTTKDRLELAERSGEDLPEISVMASGCLGLISFPRLPGRVTRETLDERYPRLLEALRGHPGIGLVLVRSERDGALVLGPRGEHRLADGRVAGEDPLVPFGHNAAAHLRRTDGFPHCPDLLVNSAWWPETEEVAAFEELVGSHGGLGGGQAHPFLLAPSDWRWPAEPFVGAEHVHRVLRGWLADLGHAAYEPAPRPLAVGQ
jgi:uncharacterized membrane protein YvlD (DUF360 family)